MAYIFRRESYMLCDYYLVPGIEEGERKKKKKLDIFFFLAYFKLSVMLKDL